MRSHEEQAVCYLCATSEESTVVVLEAMKRTVEPLAIVWDVGEKGSVKGLHLRVNRDGTKTFLLYYRTKSGTQRRPKLGAFGELTLPEARKRAKALMDRVAVGEDPKEQWDEAKAELTVAGLYERARLDHWAAERYQRSGWAREVQYLYKAHIEGPFRSDKLSELTPTRIRDWHKKYVKTPYAGNRALNVLSRMFRIAEEQELRPQNTNPCLLVKSHPEKKRKRFATLAEIKALGQCLDRKADRYPKEVAFLYILMFSGSRPRAIERATWDQLKEVEIEGKTHGVLTFKGKTSADSGEDEIVILPPQAMTILNRLPKTERGTITCNRMPSKLWKKIRDEAGCTDLWARDLRRTFATIGMSDGVNKDQIGQLLNHKTADTTNVYAKLMDHAKVAAAASIANRMEEILND